MTRYRTSFDTDEQALISSGLEILAAMPESDAIGFADRLGGVVEASRWWIWSIAAAAPVIVVFFALWSVNRSGYEPPTLAEWAFFGTVLFAWAFSAVAGLVVAVALIRRRSRGEIVLGMLLSGTSALLLAGAMLLAYFA